MIGKTILHYKILEELGRGGMGVVYKAEDTKLDRIVAIKFLPRHVAANDEEKQRFVIEAKAAAAMNHPNIATIYAIEEVDDPAAGKETFIVMEYIDGMDLKDKISTGKLPIEEVLKIAIQIAEGLQTAHEKGIIHRDIKSSNIMLTAKGKVKVMDFGLAKVAGGAMLTKTGTTLGTVAYMSPEQARGNEVDQRSDIWAFGVILYEMLTGNHPFKGEYEQAVTYSIVNENPVPVQETRPDVPPELTKIVNKCLEKEPESRYQHADEILVDLHSIVKESETKKLLSRTKVVDQETGKEKRSFLLPGVIVILALVIITAAILFFGREEKNSERIPIAVADFVNQTNEPELNGLSGMLITSMEKSRRLSVFSRSRMFDILKQMGHEDVSTIDENLGREICKQANVNALVVSSIRKFGKVYSIDLKILDPEKGDYIFTEKEDGEGQESIPTMIDRLGEKTRKGLQENVDDILASSQKVADVTTTNLEAYQHFFQGEQLINQLKFKEAIEELKKAVAQDSTFAQAYYRLAYAESWEHGYEGILKKHLEHALKYIDRIPERERYLVRAQYAMRDRNFKAGVDILKEMEKIYPDDKEMIYNIGDWLYHLHDYHNAITYLKKTLQIDPNHQRALQHLTSTYREMGNYNKMLETAKRYVAASGSEESYRYLGDAYALLGQLEQGITTFQQARDLFPENYQITGSISELYAYQGEYVRAEAELKKLIEKNQPSEVRSYGYNELSDFYPYQGKYRKALQAINRRIELLKQKNDTVNVAIEQIQRAILFFYGWNDFNRAWKEAEGTILAQTKITAPAFPGWVSLMQVYHGDYRKADSLAESFNTKWWYRAIRSLIFSSKRNEEKAEIFADSVFQTGRGFEKIIVLYELAKCQYEKGFFDKAMVSLKKLQSVNSNTWGWRAVYYPKSFYLMGKIYEKKGDTGLAIENYKKFLELWKDADQDLPDLIDAKKRLANLKGVS
jgi:tetratricopeptide (TPR) repeat protein/predicted Ser/Thr protein kinase